MKVLVLNPGSNSLKFQVIETDRPRTEVVRGEKILQGSVEPFDEGARLSIVDHAGRAVPTEPVSVASHGDAAAKVLELLDAGGVRNAGIQSLDDVQLAACRVVQGADQFRAPVLVNDEVIAAIEALGDLAPLHNAASVAVMRAWLAATHGKIPLVAVFDSAFHATLPEVAYRYGLPFELSERHGIRRYGFHGTSHNYFLLRYAELAQKAPDRVSIITLHLGGGSSAAAIKNGKSIDTSMGFTPLEGLLMGTRTGDLDPSIVGFLSRKEGVPIEIVEQWLNKKSGMLGISGISQDTRILVSKMAADRRAGLALEIFAYRVRKYIGAYLAVLEGAEAIVFGGGIGENTPEVRRRVCEGLRWLGLHLDPVQNEKSIDCEARITRENSRIHAYVIPAEEGLMMAHQALKWSELKAAR
jgi:acetate kinase